MEKIMIQGEHPLKGSVTISGAKNAAVAIIPAALLADDVVELENVPHIADIKNLVAVLKEMGIRRVLITCDASNIPSQKVIRSGGDRLEHETLDEDGVPIHRYWIDN